VQGGFSHADAVHEASRRYTIPDRWCVIPNDNEQTKRQEPYMVKLVDFLSSSERDSVRETFDSEQAAWQAIPRIKTEGEQRLAQINREQMEWAKTERQWDYVRTLFRVGAVVGVVVPLASAAIWLLITVVHWFWAHPLF